MEQSISHIGEKIRRLRLSKLMTQQELAGTQITRNMLSTIEHGTALPSLPTAIYLAERLGVPVGYLLAEESEERAYRKMLHISNIQRAFAARDFSGCLSMLNTVFGDEQDDELCLIRAECELGLALEAFERGVLRLSVAAFDRALLAAEKTVYDTDRLRDRIAVCLRYMSGISSTLVSDVLDAEEIESAAACGDALTDYILALESLEQGKEDAANEYLRRYPEALYSERIATLLMMKNGDYAGAQGRLESMLARDDLTFGVLLYEVFADLETCYRKNDDYKRAYEFSGSKLGLLEKLLGEM